MDDFVQRRLIRDKELAAPRLLHPSLQVNIRGGRLPPPGPDGVSKMQIPLTAGTANLL